MPSRVPPPVETKPVIVEAIEEKSPELPPSPPVLIRQTASIMGDKLIIFTDKKIKTDMIMKINKYANVCTYKHDMDQIALFQIFEKFDILVCHLNCSHCSKWCANNFAEIIATKRIAITDRAKQAWITKLEILNIVKSSHLKKLSELTEFDEGNIGLLLKNLSPESSLEIPSPESALKTLFKWLFRKISKIGS